MFLGLDLGTSSAKAVIVDDSGQQVAEASAHLNVSRPYPLWSEQDPADWVTASETAICSLPKRFREQVRGLGLSGQMHGATLLDGSGTPLRPAILWNDGRAHLECSEIEDKEPALRTITGNKAMPGFTAPKLAWVRKNEPEIFSKTRKVVLPKDYLRFVWTGDYTTDMSDASGTLWLDVRARAWSQEMLTGTGLEDGHMPILFEGTAVTGELSQSAATRLGLPRVPVAAGAGDQAAGAVGASVLQPGEASLSLGTSGVLFLVTDQFRPNVDEATHAFCHAVPETWHQMAVILSAASAVDAVARMAGFASAVEAYAAAEAHGSSDGVLFLPYLSGERTPHDDPHAKGAFFGLTSETTPASLVHAALEGVAFAFSDGQDVLKRGGGEIETVSVIGGGARSSYWGTLLASVLDRPLLYREGAERGPANGAARLARLAVTSEPITDVCAPGPVRETIAPVPHLKEAYAERFETWRALYRSTKHLMPQGAQ
ncbi:MAG: xylulokinase [Pseudomonadota bacterium]